MHPCGMSDNAANAGLPYCRAGVDLRGISTYPTTYFFFLICFKCIARPHPYGEGMAPGSIFSFCLFVDFSGLIFDAYGARPVAWGVKLIYGMEWLWR